ncbi:phosphoglycerate kinase [Phenylobacterium aquaticum]|uniref:phosphoglycerate kinase n=1 Tax=Phenylobacterium aquaticum TaxID=1763816 RepID=UPI001F5C8319|nr:phosphoglycerate kinase [Phenylobacterium aquaticum]
MGFRTLGDADVASKRILVRVDFNVPVEAGRIVDDARVKAALPTIADLRKRRGRVILISHFDRPEGQRVPSMSLRPLAPILSQLIGAPVAFAEDCIGPIALGAVDKLRDGDVLLLENLRFHPGEEANDPAFARALAALADLYVNDAFSAAHRAHASTEGVAHLLPAYPGRSMQTELEHLERALGSPKRPVIALVGGAKVSTKIDLLNNLVGKLDYLAIGGGMANTFRFAQGHDVGASLAEKELAEIALKILDRAQALGCRVLLPTDVVVAETLDPGAPSRVIELDQIRPQERILDLGPVSLRQILAAINESATLIWNGPLGVFEVPPFDAGTLQVARHAAALAKSGKLIAVAGGGDTAAALGAAGLADDFSFVSTAGGAFLEWMAGKTLPGVAALDS